MFSGIIEEVGFVKNISREGSNIHLIISCSFCNELKVDQSVAHNGVCLTVVNISGGTFEVICIEETLSRSNLGNLKAGDPVNLERCLKIGDRLDGHIVQGHVDETGKIKSKEDRNGSWVFSITYNNSSPNVTVEKGSICVNGVSLTIVKSMPSEFSIAIIPYTLEHTNFSALKVGDSVNLEFDVVGKYISRLAGQYLAKN